MAVLITDDNYMENEVQREKQGKQNVIAWHNKAVTGIVKSAEQDT